MQPKTQFNAHAVHSMRVFKVYLNIAMEREASLSKFLSPYSSEDAAVKATLTSDLPVEGESFPTGINKWSHHSASDIQAIALTLSAWMPPDLVPITLCFHCSWPLFLSPLSSICVIIRGPDDKRIIPVYYKYWIYFCSCSQYSCS